MPNSSAEQLRVLRPQPVQETRRARKAGSHPAFVARIDCVAGADLHLVLPDGTKVCARTTVPLHSLDDEVLVLRLADGRHVVIGQLLPCVPVRGEQDGDLLLKGQRVRIEAGVELVLQAGACRLQLDARGKAVTTADQIVSRARGANKVQGGTVHLN